MASSSPMLPGQSCKTQTPRTGLAMNGAALQPALKEGHQGFARSVGFSAVPHLLAGFQTVLQVTQILLMKTTSLWFLDNDSLDELVQRAAPNT